LNLGDVYDARIRYLGDVYSLHIKVVWKAETFLGFEIISTNPETMAFLQRLIRPMEIAASLELVDESYTADSDSGKMWFHGDQNADLFIWRNTESGAMIAWELNLEAETYSWSTTTGLRHILKSSRDVVNVEGHLSPDHDSNHNTADRESKMFAVDIVMALPHPIRDQILETLKC